MNFWTDCFALDAEPEAVLALFDHYAGRRRVAARKLSCGLNGSGAAELGGRLDRLLDLAPEVLEAPAAWQWSQELLRTARLGDTAGFHALERQFTRFEVAGAVLSSTGWDGRWPFANEVVVLPGTGHLVHDEAPVVVAGELSPVAARLPLTRGLTVDAVDLCLRGRSAPRFTFVGSDAGEGFAAELAAALQLADLVAPTLSTRLRTTVVPVHAPYGWVEAATDEQTPGVTYCSFGRSSSDLLAALAHEESHAILNAATLSIGLSLPIGDGLMDVPWKPGPRPLPAVIHGLAAFGRASTSDGAPSLSAFQTKGSCDRAISNRSG